VTTDKQLVTVDDRLWPFISRNGGPVFDLLIDHNVNFLFAAPVSSSPVPLSDDAVAVSSPAKLRQQ